MNKWPIRYRLIAPTVVAVIGVTVMNGWSNSASAAKTSHAKPVTFAIDYTATGVLSFSSVGTGVGLQAWEKWTNAHGGIDGRRVQLLVENANSAATTALTGARKIAASNAVAMTLSYSTDPVIKSTIDSARIPVVGGVEISGLWGTTKYFFSAGATTLNDENAVARAGLPKHKRFGVMYISGSATDAVKVTQFKALATHAGETFVGSWAASPTGATFSAQCLSAKSSGANVVWLGLGATLSERVVEGCAAEGFSPVWVATSASATDTWLKVSALKGTKISYPEAPYFASPKQFPGLAAFDSAMTEYESTFVSSPHYGEDTLAGWIAGELFSAALTAAKVPPNKSVTRQDIISGLHKLKKETLDGLIGPATYPAHGTYQDTCVYTGEVLSGHFGITSSVKQPTCDAKLNKSLFSKILNI